MIRTKFLFVAIFFASASFAHAGYEVCVLNFERAEHPFSKDAAKIFSPHAHVKFIQNAIPTDFLTCLTLDVREIVVIAHALIDGEGRSHGLGYFRAENKSYLPILSKPFELARDFARARTKAGTPVRLKSLRLLSCIPRESVAHYRELEELISENKIDVDYSPRQNLMSLIHGKTVNTLDKAWLAESAQSSVESNGNEQEWFYAYLDLTTLGLYRSGETTVLQGRYRVKVQGAAAGLASKWSTLYIRYRDVDSLRVNESRTISTPHLDLSLAAWLNIEAGFAPKLKLQLPTEINSAGAEIGFYSRIEIKRLY